MCCSIFLLLLFRTHIVPMQVLIIQCCQIVSIQIFPSKYSYASKPALNACVPINSFFFRLCSYLISSRVVTFVHSFDSYSQYFLKIYTSLFRISPLLASQSRICFNYYHILYSVSYVFSSPAAFLISVLQLFQLRIFEDCQHSISSIRLLSRMINICFTLFQGLLLCFDCEHKLPSICCG